MELGASVDRKMPDRLFVTHLSDLFVNCLASFGTFGSDRFAWCASDTKHFEIPNRLILQVLCDHDTKRKKDIGNSCRDVMMCRLRMACGIAFRVISKTFFLIQSYHAAEVVSGFPEM